MARSVYVARGADNKINGYARAANARFTEKMRDDEAEFIAYQVEADQKMQTRPTPQPTDPFTVSELEQFLIDEGITTQGAIASWKTQNR